MCGKSINQNSNNTNFDVAKETVNPGGLAVVFH